MWRKGRETRDEETRNQGKKQEGGKICSPFVTPCLWIHSRFKISSCDHQTVTHTHNEENEEGKRENGDKGKTNLWYWMTLINSQISYQRITHTNNICQWMEREGEEREERELKKERESKLTNSQISSCDHQRITHANNIINMRQSLRLFNFRNDFRQHSACSKMWLKKLTQLETKRT